MGLEIQPEINLDLRGPFLPPFRASFHQGRVVGTTWPKYRHGGANRHDLIQEGCWMVDEFARGWCIFTICHWSSTVTRRDSFKSRLALGSAPRPIRRGLTLFESLIAIGLIPNLSAAARCACSPPSIHSLTKLSKARSSSERDIGDESIANELSVWVLVSVVCRII